MKQPRIVIVDYNVGNTHSVWNAINVLGYQKVKISSTEEDIFSADALILPGVGAFEACIKNLRMYHLDSILNEAVLVQKKPILGICVGMQLMATTGEENGIHLGLDWIPGSVKRLKLPQEFAVPHVGWNNLSYKKGCSIFEKVDQEANFYFDHSYSFFCDSEYIISQCNYGKQITAGVQIGNIFGVQFHPEKSQHNGLKIFRGFFNSI
jgi:glutamine amidotransferase